MNYDELFDEKGNCPTLGDPYRDRTETAKLLFDERGNLTYEARKGILGVVQSRQVSGQPIEPFCDIVRLIIADDFASNTKGHYSAIYLWR